MVGVEEETRIFVGGLSWETTERRLEDVFSRYGKVVEAQIMIERDTGRPRGFGFVTFADKRAVDDAMREMHGRDLDGRNISVNKAEPKVGSDGPGYGYGGGDYPSGDKGGYRRNITDRPPAMGQSDCFKCGRPGHWARECPSAGGGGKFSSSPRFPSSRAGGRGDRLGGSDRYNDRFGGPDHSGDRSGGVDRYMDDRYGDRYMDDRYGDRYMDDRYDGGRYGDRDRFDNRHGGARDRYNKNPPGDRFSDDRYGGPDRYSQTELSKESGFGTRGGGGDRYESGSGPGRFVGGSSRRERPGPYSRSSRGRRPSYDRI